MVTLRTTMSKVGKALSVTIQIGHSQFFRFKADTGQNSSFTSQFQQPLQHFPNISLIIIRTIRHTSKQTGLRNIGQNHFRLRANLSP